jgi:hypothetical protein
VKNLFVFSVLMGLAGEGAPPEDLLSHTLLTYLQTICSASSEVGDQRPPILILDQFEEVFTAHRDRWWDIDGFFVQVGEALKDMPRLGIVFALREDYVAGLDPYASHFPKGLQARFRMERLGDEGALDAVRKPAAKAGCPFATEPFDVASLLVQNLQRVKVPIYEVDVERGGEPGSALDPSGAPSGEIGTVLGPHVEAVQLQVVCSRAWENLADGESEIRWRDVGDVDEALTDFYADAVRAAAGETGLREREIRRWFDRRLITALGTRNLVLQGRQDTGGLPNAAVEVLRSRHLLSADVRAGGRWYELAHDRLIEPIREDNATWRRRNLQEFQPQAERWDDEGRPASLLLAAEALREAERWQAAHPDYKLLDFEDRFLAASREARSRAVEWEQARQAELRTNLADTGWGVIFAAGEPRLDALRAALAELLDHRRNQATQKHGEYYHEFTRRRGYRPGETAAQFLARHRVGASIAPPDRMPYYLLIVGDPEAIPYEFQYGLDVQYAVGRIHFESLEEYAQYARSVVMAESGAFSLPRHAAIFGPQNPKSQVMGTVMNDLVRPVSERLERRQPDWAQQAVLKEDATKARLGQLLGGDETPALLFTATYGLGLADGHERQLAEQGALLCQEWPGLDEAHEGIPSDCYFSAADVAEDARLLGLVAFLLTNYSAGTPRLDDFAHQSFQEPQSIAPQAFVARLPQRLLGHPRGGALAVIGHVERAWTVSFVSPGPGQQGRIAEFDLFESLFGRLMKGHTVGSAMELFNQRYTQLSSTLAEELQQVVFYDRERDDRELAAMMTQAVDARNYVILGDPAVRLPLGRGAEVVERPTIEPVTLDLAIARAAREPGPEIEPPIKGTEVLVFSGVSGATGEYLLPPMTLQEISALIQGRPQAAEKTGEHDTSF